MVFTPQLSPLVFDFVVRGLELYAFGFVPFDPAVDVKIHEAKHAMRIGD